jgi:hypothetical protein
MKLVASELEVHSSKCLMSYRRRLKRRRVLEFQARGSNIRQIVTSLKNQLLLHSAT